MASDISSSCSSSEDESHVAVRGIGSHQPGWRRRRNRIEAELDAAHDITSFRVKTHTPGCLPQWQSGQLVVPRLKSTYPSRTSPLPFSNSMLGRLPTELRLKIYGYAFGCPDRPISIRKRLVSGVPGRDGLQILPSQCKQPAPHSHWYHDCWDGKLLASGDKTLMSLVLTCRQIYEEAIRLLYSHRTFSFHNVESLSSFLDKTPAKHLNAIRSLSISTQIHYTPTSASLMAFDASFANIGDTKLWKHVCRTLCSMADLRCLRLYIAKGRYSLWASIEYQVALTLEMLSSVAGVEDYEVVFAASEEVKERFLEAPFRLRDGGVLVEKTVCGGCDDCLREA